MKASPKSFTDLETQAAWNTGALAWETFVESGVDYYRTEVHLPSFIIFEIQKHRIG